MRPFLAFALFALAACGSSDPAPSSDADAATDAAHDAPSSTEASTDAAADTSPPDGGDGGDPTHPDGGALPPPFDAAAAPCNAPSDCRLFEDTCGSCKCLALPVGAPDPTCSDPPVSCLVNPCQGKAAACTNNTCTLQ